MKSAQPPGEAPAGTRPAQNVRVSVSAITPVLECLNLAGALATHRIVRMEEVEDIDFGLTQLGQPRRERVFEAHAAEAANWTPQCHERVRHRFKSSSAVVGRGRQELYVACLGLMKGMG